MLDMNYDGLGITIENYVAVVEIQRGPNNFFDTQMISDLADAFNKMEASDDVRAVVLCSEGKHFCAGNNFGSASGNEERADRRDSRALRGLEVLFEGVSDMRALVNSVDGSVYCAKSDS